MNGNTAVDTDINKRGLQPSVQYFDVAAANAQQSINGEVASDAAPVFLQLKPAIDPVGEVGGPADRPRAGGCLPAVYGARLRLVLHHRVALLAEPLHQQGWRRRRAESAARSLQDALVIYPGHVLGRDDAGDSDQTAEVDRRG